MPKLVVYCALCGKEIYIYRHAVIMGVISFATLHVRRIFKVRKLPLLAYPVNLLFKLYHIGSIIPIPTADLNIVAMNVKQLADLKI